MKGLISQYIYFILIAMDISKILTKDKIKFARKITLQPIITNTNCRNPNTMEWLPLSRTFEKRISYTTR